MYDASNYMTITVPFADLEKLLNTIEDYASGYYEIISCVSLNTARGLIGIVIRFVIKETDPPFNQEEIMRRLGYGENNE